MTQQQLSGNCPLPSKIGAGCRAGTNAVWAAGFMASLFTGVAAQAESRITSGPATAVLSASASLDFRVIVPRVLFVSIGSGSNMADNTTIDRVDFNVPAGDVGTGNATAATAGSGAYPVTARVMSNGNSVSFTATGSAGGLTSGAQSIPWSQIAPMSGGALPHPAIGTGTAGVAATLTANGGVVDKSAIWNFSYSNSSPLAAGNYYGRVFYTAALP